MSTPTRTPRAPDDTTAGSTPSAPRRSPRMQAIVVAVSAGLLIGAALIFFFVARSDSGSSPRTKSVSGEVKLMLGGVSNVNAGTPATLGDDAAAQIMEALGQYVDKGLIAPVKTGEPPPTEVAGLFDGGTQAAIQGPDKDVLFENGSPKRTGNFKPTADPVIITALSDGNGQFVLATAGFNYRADVGVEGGTMTTARTVALTFAPENGPWKITGYDVTVTRQGAQVEGSTTSAAKK